MATAETVRESARREPPAPLPAWGGRPGDPGLADAETGQLQAVDDDQDGGDDDADPQRPARRAATVVAFLRGVRRGQRAAAAEGVTAERFGLPLSGRAADVSTVALAERYGDGIWQGSDDAPLDRSGDDVRRPWM
jgi:hypothetical protein